MSHTYRQCDSQPRPGVVTNPKVSRSTLALSLPLRSRTARHALLGGRGEEVWVMRPSERGVAQQLELSHVTLRDHNLTKSEGDQRAKYKK